MTSSSPPGFGRTIKLLSQRWRESDEDLTLETSIVGLIARGRLSEQEGARWLSRLTTSPHLATILRNFASGDWSQDRFKELLRSQRLLEGGQPNDVGATGAQLSPNDKLAKLLAERWDEVERSEANDDSLALEKSIVGLIARGELSEHEGARWLSRLTTSTQLASILRNYASDKWDDERFRALFRAYMSGETAGAPSPHEKIAKLLTQRWDEVERSGAGGDPLAQEKAIVGLIARGELSEHEGARWLSRLTTSTQLASILRNYASVNWDDDRFRALFRAYMSGEAIVAPSPNDKIAKLLTQRWDKAEQSGSNDDPVAQEKAIVGVIARGELSEHEGARWLSRLTTSTQLASILRNYASADWDDERFRGLYRSYAAGESAAVPSQNDKVAKLLAQRWDKVERSGSTRALLTQEKAIVGVIARGEFSEQEGIRWASRLTKNPQLASILRNYASDTWDDERFRALFRAYAAGESATAPSPNDKIAKLLAQRWDEFERSGVGGEPLAQEKAIVGVIARGDLTEVEGARWLSRLTASPQLGSILRNYASANWDDERFRALYRAYMSADGGAAPSSPNDKIAKLLAQRWDEVERAGTGGDPLAQEKSIVGLIARGELSEIEGARWLSRLTASPLLASILRNFASDGWDEERFRGLFRSYLAGEGATVPSANDKIGKLLAQRWDEAERSERGEAGEQSTHEKTIVGLIARGQLSEREGARWLSRVVVSPHFAALLRDYASDGWDEILFRQVFRIYRGAQALDETAPTIDELGSSAVAKLSTQGRIGKKLKSSSADSKYVALNSFPKSGNTWIRQFLSCLCFDGDLAAIPDHYHHDINQAPIFRMPNGDPVRFYKSHDKSLPTMLDGRVVDHAAAIHIRRHPLDVFISYLNFMHLESDEPASRRSPFLIQAENLSDITGQDLTWAFLGVFMVFGTVNPKFQAAGSWFQNVEEWTGLKGQLPIVSLKYESLISNGADDLMSIGAMLGKTPDDVRAAFARAQELTAVDGRFFWRQEIGTHKKYLTPAQIDAFYKLHGEKLAKFGYERRSVENALQSQAEL